MSDSNADLAAVECRDDRLVKFILAFDKGWRDGLLNETVALTADWLEDERLEALSQLVLVDLEKQWHAGRVVLAEEYLQRWPLLGTSGDGLIELLLTEWDLRQQRGEVGSVKELSKRFPERADELAQRIQERESASSSLSVTATDTSRRKKLLRATGSSTPATAEQLEQLGRFQLEELVGEGAFGWVYRARDSALDRVVAIKVAKSIVTDEDRQRFLREARSAAGLRHSNTCKVHDFGTLDGRDYIVMEFIDGQPLSKLLTSGTKFTEPQIADTIRKAALALQEAHDKGVIHRDLKPANIMIDRLHEPIVTDFGLARRDHASEALISQSGQIMGTAAYMSPEQARGDGKSVGPASDVYSLGVVLYELLCGRRPFLGTATEVLGQIQYVAVEPPSSYSPGLDPRLEAICLKALCKNPAERYASMTHFAEALSDCLKVMSSSAGHRGNTAALPNTSTSDTEPINSNDPELAPTTILSRKAVTRWRSLSRTHWIMTGVVGVLLVCGVVIIIKTPNGKFKIKWPDETVVAKKKAGDDTTKLHPTTSTVIKPPQAGQASSPSPIERRPGKERDDNEIGMKFCWCPPGQFLMGSQAGETAVGTADGRVSVTLSQGFWLGKFEVTQAQYKRIMGSNPSSFSSSGDQAKKVDGIDTSRLPVDSVGRAAALEFCRKMTVMEHGSGRIGNDEEFTLPTEAQWEYACRAGVTHWWVFGHEPSLQEANFGGEFDIFPDALRRTSIVGQYPANAWGLHDTPGNVAEWVRDWHRDQLTGGIDPEVAKDDSDGQEVIRGGSWLNHPGVLRSAGREAIKTHHAYHNTGFRVALVQRRSDAMTNKSSPPRIPPAIEPPVEPQPARAPFDVDEAKRVRQAWANFLGVPAMFENSIGMTFSLIPPGEFEMGGGRANEDMLANNGNLRHRVRLTKPYYFATFETRQRDYQALMGTNPSKFHALNNGGLDHPVEMMLISDAEEFCRRLSVLAAERTAQRVYRLPTEAEWEYACRAGTNTLFAFGETLTRQ